MLRKRSQKLSTFTGKTADSDGDIAGVLKEGMQTDAHVASLTALLQYGNAEMKAKAAADLYALANSASSSSSQTAADMSSGDDEDDNSNYDDEDEDQE